MSFEIGGTVGPYQIESLLGSGGMGTVYLARHADLERLVALKVVRDASVGGPAHDRFIREARSIAKLDHPNIVRVYDFGHHKDEPFIAMEYVKGTTLSRLRHAAGDVHINEVSAWITQLCDGLAHAHAAGVVHRDIKPANLIVNEAGVLKILDFGIAYLGTNAITQTGVAVGTPHYMSPEQLTGAVADHRTDLFSAGAVMFELFAGRRPFEGPNQAAIVHAVLHGTPRLRLGEAPPEFAPVIYRALRKDIGLRYQSAEELREAFTQAHAAFRQGVESAPMTATAFTPAATHGTRHARPRWRQTLYVAATGIAVAASAWALQTRRGMSPRVDTQLARVEAPRSFSPDNSSEPKDVRPQAPAPISAERRETASDGAARLMRSGREREALRAILAAAPNPELRQVLAELHQRAEARVRESRQKALAVDADVMAPEIFARAEATAGEARSAPSGAAAVEIHWAAAELYGESERTARARPQEPDRDPRLSETDDKSDGRVHAGDKSASTLLDAVEQYTQAMNARDAAAVKSIQPNINQEDLARAFAAMRNLEVIIEDITILTNTGTVAKIRCKITQIVISVTGTKQGNSMVRTMRLRHADGRWVVDGFED